MKTLLTLVSTVIIVISCNSNKSNGSFEENNSFPKGKIPTKCKKCSIEFLKDVQKSPFDDKKVQMLLCIIDKNCDKNVEFSEMYDGVIYSLLENNPMLFLKHIENESNVSQKIIFDKIASPLLDYNYDRIIKKVNVINKYKLSRVELVKSLEKAKSGDV